MGIHAATDNRMGEVFGGFFCGHPWSEEVGVKIDDPDHALTKVFEGKDFMVNDEIYQFDRIHSREKLHILLSLDMNKTADKGRREEGDNAVAWVKSHGKGRIFYCSLGHNHHIFHYPKLLRFYLDGIQFALGDIKAEMAPSGPIPESKRFKRTPLKLPADGIFEGNLVAWQYSGPYEAQSQEAAFTTEFALEKDPARVKWKTMPFGLDRGRPWALAFDRIKDLYGDNHAIYLRTTVVSPKAMKARLEAGSDDGLKIWLNGKVVHENNVTRGLDRTSDKLDFQLRKGPNTLLMKVTQGGDWTGCLALRGDDGQAIAGLTCTAAPAKSRKKSTRR